MVRRTIVAGGLCALVSLALMGCPNPPPPGTDAANVGCGNGTLDMGEACEGGSFGGQTCATLGFSGGTLSCTAACTIDTSACTMDPLPDLIVYANGLDIGLNVRTNTAPTACEAALGCGGGTSGRSLMDFTLVSENIGTATLYFGNPNTTDSWPAPYTGLWEVNACGYRAFHDYATYWLCSGTDMTACAAPGAAHAADGFKESFCFIENFGDAPDWTGADAACGMYGCGNMGQQPGCADDYYPGLDCQWIDVTGLAAGSYVLCAHIDPQNVVVELNDDNNIGCKVITL